jgi:hypothetical protein
MTETKKDNTKELLPDIIRYFRKGQTINEFGLQAQNRFCFSWCYYR